MIKFEKDEIYTAVLNEQYVYAKCIDIFYIEESPYAMFEVENNPELIYWGKIKRCSLMGGGMQETIINDELSVYSGE